jgi:glycosyl-4,4'-diaponeurosporenoate acyltransferase
VIAVVALDAAVWAAWSAAVGLVASRQPVERFDHDNWLTCDRHAERAGHTYERLGIRRWKDHVPEAGQLFGGRSKRALGGATPAGLAAFAAETRRAEIVHWAILVVVPVFALWNPAPLMPAMVAYAIVANLPCIAIQRYNRLRINRMVSRRAVLGAGL